MLLFFVDPLLVLFQRAIFVPCYDVPQQFFGVLCSQSPLDDPSILRVYPTPYTVALLPYQQFFDLAGPLSSIPFLLC